MSGVDTGPEPGYSKGTECTFCGEPITEYPAHLPDDCPEVET